ncbi:MAG: squalene/phytoene synthase family protein [Bacteroidia bacterium]|nr:squalene/phytoene synthase family protein [Bacteroidia bacterium]
MKTSTTPSIPLNSRSHLSEKTSTFLQPDDHDFQSYLLKGVSRTFALTIPTLPDSLRYVVTNAYLLCRAVDTIEDEPTIHPAQKRILCEEFVQVVAGASSASKLSGKLSPLLSPHTIPAEHELIAHLERVICITHQFSVSQRNALERCVRIMAEGMAFFQDHNSARGLATLADMDRYCYYVAGVVGEMLTDLFCDYSPAMAKNHQEMMILAVSFGQGLQMTNILKDIWEDQTRDTCWLPRDVFAQQGFNLDDLGLKPRPRSFEKGLEYLLGVAHAHLKNAFRYTLYIPPQEKGIREFCLWALGMAVLTLHRINRNRDFSRGEQVKISRKSVKATIITTHLTVSNNFLLRLLFNASRWGLPISKLNGFPN